MIALWVRPAGYSRWAYSQMVWEQDVERVKVSMDRIALANGSDSMLIETSEPPARFGPTENPAAWGIPVHVVYSWKPQ